MPEGIWSQGATPKDKISSHIARRDGLEFSVDVGLEHIKLLAERWWF